MMRTVFDTEKALTVMLYLAAEMPEQGNLYKILKAVYRANKRHLEHYGREVFKDQYQALAYGTVPAYAYDITTHLRDGKPKPDMPRDVALKMKVSKTDTVTALEKPNLKYLSKTDIECLEEAVKFYRHKTFNQVKNNAHEDKAYKAAKLNSIIPIEDIIRTFPDGELFLQHIKAA
jgi:hypothetical protein